VTSERCSAVRTVCGAIGRNEEQNAAPSEEEEDWITLIAVPIFPALRQETEDPFVARCTRSKP